jgi:hypothetical protein
VAGRGTQAAIALERAGIVFTGAAGQLDLKAGCRQDGVPR